MEASGRPQQQSAAFFDFDKTLLHGDAGVIFGKTLGEWGFSQGRHLPEPERRRHNAAVIRQIVRIVGTATGYRILNAMGIIKRSQLVERSYRFLEGFPAEEMTARMQLVWDEKLRERLYPEMRRVLAEHRSAGRRIAIVTTGLRELVEHSKHVLGDDIDVIGAEMQKSQEGNWLGTVVGPLYGVHKADAVRDYAAKHDIDLAESYAYSDHYSDVAFLDVVGHPVAVNPGLRLQLYAAKHGWDVLWVLPPTRSRVQPPE